MLGAREHEHLLPALRADERRESSRLRRGRPDARRCVDRLRRSRCAARPRSCAGGRAARRRAPGSRRRTSRRTAGSAAALRQQREDAPDVADEAHVEHPVRFVEHEDLDAATGRPCAADDGRAAAPAWRRGCRRRGASASICGPMLTPPKTTVDVSFEVLAVGRDDASTCAASSRVGVRISARTARAYRRVRGVGRVDRRCSIGRTKPAVLPVPVCAPASSRRPRARRESPAPGWASGGIALIGDRAEQRLG